MKEVQMMNGKVSCVDDADYEWLSQFTWNSYSSGYAVRNEKRLMPCGSSKWVTVRMHRQILGVDQGDDREVDHIDGDRLNNQRSNLRLATRAQNQWNVARWSTNTSGFKGARWVPKKRKWEARIRHNGKRYWLGFFDTALLAHEFYCLAADMLRGEYANHG